jgi:hypothetical protein
MAWKHGRTLPLTWRGDLIAVHFRRSVSFSAGCCSGKTRRARRQRKEQQFFLSGGTRAHAAPGGTLPATYIFERSSPWRGMLPRNGWAQ